MGLDLALGAFVLIWAIRGWFTGFVLQAITLGALIGSVYLADPIRGMARPYAAELFPAIGTPVLDRLLWWGSAVAAFVVVSGLGGWVVKLKRRRPYAEYEPNRTDQGAGFLLGAAKGAVVASFLVAAIANYAPNHLKPGGVFEAQAQASQAMSWSLRYRPAEQIWASPPVQSFVAHVKRRGFWGDGEELPIDVEAEAPVAETPAPDRKPANAERAGAKPPAASADDVRTASRAPSLSLPRFRRLDPNSPTFDRDLRETLDELRLGSP